MSVIKYLVADDHKIFREGLKLALSDDPGISCVGEAGNGKEVLDLLHRLKPDVILLDIKMPEMDGIETVKRIRETDPDVKLVMITMYEDEHFIIHLMEAGANGYLIKNAEPEEIKAAIHTAHHTGHYFNDYVSNVLLRKVIKKDERRKPEIRLSDRELQVLTLICQERTASEIGKQIFLSARTVEGIKSGLIEKLGVRNTAGLVVYALKNGVIE